jgi:hypothetical protein
VGAFERDSCRFDLTATSSQLGGFNFKDDNSGVATAVGCFGRPFRPTITIRHLVIDLVVIILLVLIFEHRGLYVFTTVHGAVVGFLPERMSDGLLAIVKF